MIKRQKQNKIFYRHLPKLSRKMQQYFFKYQAQTTHFAAGFEVEKAEGSYIFGKDGRKYLDFVAGVSANTLGHSHTKIVEAIKTQAEKYLHVMVYGEYAQEMPVK